MSHTRYDYDITTSTQNRSTAVEKLQGELLAFSPKYGYFEREGPKDLRIFFDPDIDAAEKTALDALVLAHDGVKPQPKKFKVAGTVDGVSVIALFQEYELEAGGGTGGGGTIKSFLVGDDPTGEHGPPTLWRRGVSILFGVAAIAALTGAMFL